MFERIEIKRGVNFALGLVLVIVPLCGVALMADGLNVFSRGETISSAKVNANFQKIVPIGAVVAWHKDLSGVPGLPDGWVEWNGGSVSDAESPLNGQAIPDLNSDTGNGGGGYFIRGNSSVTTGTLQADAFQGHGHELLGHARSAAGGGGFVASNVGGTTIDPTVRRPVVNTGHGSPRFASETRPSNVSMIWIMRIK